MTSTSVYLTEEQQKRLLSVGRRLRVPMAVLIREGIDMVLTARGAPATPEGQRETAILTAHPLMCDCSGCLNGDRACPQ